MLGELNRAEAILHPVLGIASAMGQHQHAETIRMNLSLIASERLDFERAWELAEEVRAAGLQGAVVHFVAAVELPAAAGTGRFDELDRALTECEELSVAHGITDWDLAATARQAGDLAVAAGKPSLARRAYQLAVHQLEALGADEVDVLRERITALGG